MRPHSGSTPRRLPSGRPRLLVRGAVATGMSLAVLAGVAAAGPGQLGAPSAAAAVQASTADGAAPGTVRVDPQRCSMPAPDPVARAQVQVVCTVDQVAAHLIDRGAVVLSGVRHRGSLDLRGRTGITLRGEPGAVLDADGGRFALSLRDVNDVRVEAVTLQGGTAQSVWVERTRGVRLRHVTVQGSGGSGIQVRDSAGFALTDSRVQDAASAGVMELTGVTGSSYTGLVVTRNGRGPAVHNGDGLQLSGTGVTVRGVVTTGNGSSARYEHGIYVSTAARSVVLRDVRSSGNAGVAVKLGGSGTLDSSALQDDRLALYCGRTADRGWTVRRTSTRAATAVAVEPGCRLTR